MTELELLQSILDKLGDIQSDMVDLQLSIDAILSWVTAIQTYLTFLVIVGAGVAIVYMIIRPFFKFY